MRKRQGIPKLIAVLFIIFSVLLSSPLGAQERLQKKLVEYGWDVPYPDFVQKYIRDMEKRPFDGVIFRTKDFDHAFDTRRWKPADLKSQLDILASIRWGKFTDNFLTLYAANKWNMDWFNDAQWKTISANMKLVSKAVKAGRCMGVVFDPEPYGENPWLYPGKNKDKSFAEVQSKVRQRGAQFMNALQSEKSDLKVLNFFQLALFGVIVDEPDPKIREQKWVTVPWHSNLALMPAFFLGMLDAARPGARIIDGNEQSYYYESAADYYREYHLMKQRVQALVPPALRGKFNSQAEAGMALYVDQALGMRGDTKTTGFYMSSEERLKFFEHNVYYALTTTDEYVWLYSEKMNWWKDFVPGPSEGTKTTASGSGSVPAGLEEAVISAHQKYKHGKPLGFDIQDMVKAAREKRAADKKEMK